jgi:hypothetical protein
MKKFNALKLNLQVFWVYCISIIISLAFSPAFFKLYIWSFNPPRQGSGLFYVPDFFGIAFTGGIFALYFFLPIISFLLLQKRQHVIWFTGIIIPLLVFILGGRKYVLWAIILSFLGYLLAQIILLATKKLVKQ